MERTPKPKDRVTTPQGIGTIAYQRMKAPDYNTVLVYSVVLDQNRAKPGYSGTVFWSHEVKCL